MSMSPENQASSPAISQAPSSGDAPPVALKSNEGSVSVIIAAHNGQRYIGEALQSVIQQSHAPLEIIVVDDSSRDGTKHIVEQYPTARYVRVDYSNTPRTRQHGALLARGHWLAFLDQDDIWMPDKLSHQLRYLHENPALDAVIGMQYIFLQPGYEKPHWLKHNFLERPLPGYLPSALVVNREKLIASGGFEPTLHLSSDVAFFLSAAALGIKVGSITEVVVKRRIHDQNDSHDVNGIQAGILKAIKQSLVLRRTTNRTIPSSPTVTLIAHEGLSDKASANSKSGIKTQTVTQPKACAPKISVIVAVYNGENYLREAINSVLTQDYPNIELVVVNDGSSDGTARLLEDYVLKNYAGRTTIAHQSNQGLGPARNAGIGQATGEYFAFLDHDDWWATAKLKKQMQLMRSADNDPLVFSYVAQFLCPTLSEEKQQQIRVDTQPMPGPVAGTLLVSRQRFDEVGEFWKQNESGDFIDWYLRATDLNLPMVMCPEVHLYRRIHRSNMGRQPDKYDRRAYLKALKSSLDRRRNAQQPPDHTRPPPLNDTP